jgi:hypothetical protein
MHVEGIYAVQGMNAVVEGSENLGSMWDQQMQNRRLLVWAKEGEGRLHNTLRGLGHALAVD